jgi:outer membrane protein OmpA-like peptidoglycan-associated protein
LIAASPRRRICLALVCAGFFASGAASAQQAASPPVVRGSDTSEQEIYDNLHPKLPEAAPSQPSIPGLVFRGAHRAGQDAAPPPRLALAINFAFASREILPDSQALLRKLANVMARDDMKASRFQIVGHTDSVGSAASNMQLSTARADAVRIFLVREGGIESERLSIVGRGSAEPLNLADGAAAENRRVEIINQGAGAP